jgi:ABC-2 type transport system ATP-binding protein
MSLIEVKDLTKKFRQAIKKPGLKGSIQHLFTQKYEDKPAVQNINFKIEKGESVAYVGPNGAGKSTTIKMLTGILVPSSGEVRIDGILPYKQRMENAKKIGVVFGQRTQLWWDLPIIESFHLLKDIYEIPDQVYKENMDEFKEILNINDFLHMPARKLSLGQRMRADLAAALLHDPRIVYLDEPTIGLDIVVKENIRKYIKRINHETSKTILLTSHDLEDIEDLCERLIIIDQGKVIYDGTLDIVKDTYARERIIHFQVSTPLKDSSIISRLNGVQINENRGLYFSIIFDRFQVTASDVVKLIMRSNEIIDFHIDEPKIEKVIKRVYNHDLNLNKKQGGKEKIEKIYING